MLSHLPHRGHYRYRSFDWQLERFYCLWRHYCMHHVTHSKWGTMGRNSFPQFTGIIITEQGFGHLGLARFLCLPVKRSKTIRVPTKPWEWNSMTFPWLSKTKSAIFHDHFCAQDLRHFSREICYWKILETIISVTLVWKQIRKKFIIFHDHSYGWDPC